MKDFFNKVRENENFPFETVLSDMGITEQTTKIEFVETVKLFAENCYGIAKAQQFKEHEQLKGYFNWQTISPARFFRIHFTYYHTEDLIISIDGFQEMTYMEYITNLDAPKEDGTQVINNDSTLAKNTINKHSN